ncbi:CASP7 [Cordylochernes scorpioides]|uniref:CASP7 n=1 Tax=Cordylochernes scorpioides TaxID=51811 RepID=A0ABY6LRB7_9ARAC|nr:CASP7 [Cordylochernes scorpioides]
MKEFLLENNSHHWCVFQKFEPQINLNERRGTELDAQQLFKVFKLLEFEVKVYHNLSTRDMRMVLESEGKADHSERDCFACCILSHGDRGVIYGTDGKMMTDLVFSPFLGDACPSLAGKPKMFFIQVWLVHPGGVQACQGDRLDPGVMVSNGDRRDSGAGSSYVSVPVHADFLIAYSTVPGGKNDKLLCPGYYSWRNTTQGSWFIQSLAAVLESNSQDLDLLTMMTLVNHRVAHNFQSCVPGDQEMDRKKQIPYIASMLTRRIFFLPKSG